MRLLSVEDLPFSKVGSARARRPGGVPRVAWCLLAVSLVACTSTELRLVEEEPPVPRDDKLSVSGVFCTEEPEPRDFPLRVMFVIDTSQSMNITDPPPEVCVEGDCFSRRGEAVLEVLEDYRSEAVMFALLTFESDVRVNVDREGKEGFTTDLESLVGYLGELDKGFGETNYQGALSKAYEVLEQDMRKLDSTIRSRARYVVIFISDGMPAPVTAEGNQPQQILEDVRAIKGLEQEQRLGEIRLHTVYLAGPRTPDTVQERAKELLAEMARVGGGTFRTFGATQGLDFLHIDFHTFMRIFAMKSIVVTNQSARLRGDGAAEPDSDGDGVLDVDEIAPGSDPLLVDSDGDGWSDLLEVRLHTSGFDPTFSGDAECALDIDRLDDDGDGLANCEERFLGTSSRLIDSDADGLPDDIELRAGTDPVANDVRLDSDFDGAVNELEVRAHTDPLVADSADFSARAYRYSIREASAADLPPGRLCYELEVDNIALATTAAVDGVAAGTNTVMVRVVSAPRDSPSDYGSHLVGCVRPRYRMIGETEIKDPPSGRMILDIDDFRRPDEFDASQHCVKP
ncbi:MAG: VWA domain-containing protein [Pseudomonadota bacterium]